MKPGPGEFDFPFMVFGVPPPGDDLRIVFAPVSDIHVSRIAQQLRKHLAEPLPPMPPEMEKNLGSHDIVGAPTAYPQFDIAGYPSLHAALDRFGQTAAMAQWIHRMTVEVGTGRRGGSVYAVSLYLSGVDPAADNCAISTCSKLRFGPSRAGLPITPAAFEKIANESRPLAVQIFLQPLARIDPSIRYAFLALGTAFFGLLGVKGDHDTQS